MLYTNAPPPNPFWTPAGNFSQQKSELFRPILSEVNSLNPSLPYYVVWLRLKPGLEFSPGVTSSVVLGLVLPPSKMTWPLVRLQLV